MLVTHLPEKQGYARVLRLVGLEHEDLVSLDNPDGQARLDEGRGLIERGKRHAQVIASRKEVLLSCDFAPVIC